MQQAMPLTAIHRGNTSHVWHLSKHLVLPTDQNVRLCITAVCERVIDKHTEEKTAVQLPQTGPLLPKNAPGIILPPYWYEISSARQCRQSLQPL
jgi:hypothetical protein